MNRARRAVSVACCAVMATTLYHEARAADKHAQTIAVPCASYTEGNAWVKKTTTDTCTIEAETVVLSNTGGTIVLGEKTTTTCQMPYLRKPQTATFEMILKEEGDTLYLVGANHSALGTQTTMRIPFCGEVPTASSALMQTTGAGPTISFEQILTVEPLGRESVTTPAGTFDTTVVEARTRNTSKDNPAANYDQIMTVFAAEDVGIVKMIIKVDNKVQAPAPNAENDQKIGQMLQDGIAAMMESGDMGDIDRKLTAMAERAGAEASTGAVVKRTTLVTELESYSIR